MFRALSSRSRRGGYERLFGENDDSCYSTGVVPIDNVPEITLKRAKTLPVGKLDSLFSTKKIRTQKPLKPIKEIKEREEPQKKKKKNTISHPLFSLFDGRRKNKKTTAKPEFTRYLEYVKEGGMWDLQSNKPVIYFK